MTISCPHCLKQLDALANLHARGLLQIGENVLVQVHDARTRELLDEQRIHNMVVNTGLTLLANLLDGTEDPISHFACGTDYTNAAATQEGLLAEVYRNTVSSRQKIDFEITHRCFVPPSSANGNTIYEAGLFNSASSTAGQTVMFSRVVHDAIAKTISNTITYSWTHTFGRA